MRKKLLIFLLFICSFSTFGQQYPVQLLTNVQAPAPVNFYNYADESSLNSPITVQIFLNDLTVSNRQIKLKTYFEGGNIQFQSKDFVLGAEELFIDGGIPLILRNTELAPYYKYENIQGIGVATYGQSIPEGSYDFCFEVFDYLSGSKLSAKKCTKVFIFKNEPPILNLPFNGTNIAPKDFENIVFQWTPRHLNVSNVEYELSIVEIWDNSITPQTAFLSQAPIYQETTRATSILYGPDKPQLLADKRYAWRIQAKALQGLEEIGLFKNEGYSEVFWFSRTSPCQVPENISGEPKGLSKINVYWNEDPTVYSDYIIAYREADKPDAHWFTKKTNSAWATIWNLKPGTTYEYKVKGKCTYQYSEYSEVQYVTTEIVKNEDANYQCGIVPDEIAITNREPHPGLAIGSQITAGDFKVVITDITSQSPGALSGKGYVSIPYLNFAKFAVNFSNILVNTDNRLAQGEIVTVYDSKFGEGASMTVDVNVNISEGINGDKGDTKEITVDFVVDSVTIDANGAIVVTGTNAEGEADSAVIPGDKDTKIISSNGDVWSIGEDGKITKEEGAEGGAVVAGTTNGVDSNGEVNQVTADGVLVTFEDSGYYSYDALPKNTSSELEAEYRVIETKNGNKYEIPYKAISDNNGEDFIYANVEITDSSIVKDSIIFKTKEGAKVDVLSWNGNKAKLKLVRKLDYAHEEIYATIKNKEGKYDVAGTLITTHLASQELEAINVVLVPVGVDIDSDLITKTKEIYAKAGVRLNIQTLEEVDKNEKKKKLHPDEIYGWDKDNNGSLEVGDSKILSNYTNEEKAFNGYIKNQNYYNKKAYYIFVTNIPTTKSEVDGFMPLKRQFGFVFTAQANTVTKQARTLAHELGHGIFGLKHTWDEYNFSQRATNFLMDYGTGTVLNHLDWKKLHAPGIQLYWFQGDEDGESGSASYDFVAEDITNDLLVEDKLSIDILPSTNNNLKVFDYEGILSSNFESYVNNYLISGKYTVRVITYGSQKEVEKALEDDDDETRPKPNEIVLLIKKGTSKSFVQVLLGTNVLKELSEKSVSKEDLITLIKNESTVDLKNSLLNKQIKQNIFGYYLAEHSKEYDGSVKAFILITLLDTVISGIEDFELADNIWDPSKSNYSPIIKSDKLQNAYVCGLYNGLIQEAKAIPELAKLLIKISSSEKNRKQFGSEIDKLIEKGILNSILEGLKKKYAGKSPYYLSYESGKTTVAVGTMFVSFGSVTKAGKLTSLVKIVNPLKGAIDFLNKVTKAGLVVYKKSKNVFLLKVTLESSIVLAKLDVDNILKEIKWLNEGEIISYLDDVKYLDDSGNIVEAQFAYVKKNNGEVGLKVTNAGSELINKLKGKLKLGDKWDDFVADFKDNTNALRRFNKNPKLTKVWKMLFTTTRRNDLKWLDQMSDWLDLGVKSKVIDNVIHFTAPNGFKFAKIKGNKLYYNYDGFGGDILVSSDKVTTVLGKFFDPPKFGTSVYLDKSKTGLENGIISRVVNKRPPNNSIAFLDLPEDQYNSLLNGHIKDNILSSPLFKGDQSKLDLIDGLDPWSNQVKDIISNQILPNASTDEALSILKKGIDDGNKVFWNTYNKTFLEKAFKRGDDVRLVSDPDFYKAATDEIGGSYKKELIEIDRLKDLYGYKYNSVSKTFIKK
ncbi:fibronectin type III domain-containing protein [Tenacibaculum sp. S7007]|uniref:Fibronectin type III domain-containing protein n=1 Tax=Tenacibaculum pelagium TaxID=2759527 RepID=A0A839ANK3_9FLAO|nr:fibronectin type III domain-containing protein [Tenacibaculum pelagium]MBA6156665.1 fibronectin type III domain-containing protein [Tenacibaculum pelagium]